MADIFVSYTSIFHPRHRRRGDDDGIAGEAGAHSVERSFATSAQRHFSELSWTIPWSKS
jgi:hypothetical protein